MRMIRYAIAAFFLCIASPAFAVNCAVANGACFWIGGTGTMDFATDSAHWSNSSGGASCSCEPISSNTLTFDGSSGGGTVTVNATTTATSLIASAFTGTIDWSVNNNNVTIANGSLTLGGTGSPVIKMGSGLWSYTGGTATFGTLGAGSSTSSARFAFSLSSGVATSFIGNSNSFGTVTFAATSFGSYYQLGDTATFASCGVTAPLEIQITSGKTITCTAAVAFSGSSSGIINLHTSVNQGTAATLAVGASSSCSWCVFRGITSANMTTITNSFDLKGNTLGGTINGPTGGASGGFIIGG